jgi:hypothetical protein
MGKMEGTSMDEARIPKIISVDDHVVEPSHVWNTWLPGRFRGNAIELFQLERFAS